MKRCAMRASQDMSHSQFESLCRKSEGVGLAIKSQVEALSHNPYDWDGLEALPMREDVKRYLQLGFAGENGASFYCVPVPSITLEADGTVDVLFEDCHKTLLLQFPCEDVIAYVKSYADGETQVSGNIRQHRTEQDQIRTFRAVDELFDWLTGRKK